MAIYIDEPFTLQTCLGKKKWVGGCHLVADTLEELHDFAVNQLKLKRSWFQCPPRASRPHYDLTANKRELAIAKGAVEISGREFCQKAKKLKNIYQKSLDIEKVVS